MRRTAVSLQRSCSGERAALSPYPRRTPTTIGPWTLAVACDADTPPPVRLFRTLSPWLVLLPRSLWRRLQIDSFLDMGADLTFLSAFPHEREILYPPLTLIVPWSAPRKFKYGETTYTVIDASVRMPLA